MKWRNRKISLKDADDEMKEEEDARDILEDRQGEFVNEMYHDIARSSLCSQEATPSLTKRLKYNHHLPRFSHIIP